MTTATIYSLTRDILNVDATVLPDSKLLEWLNIAYGHRILQMYSDTKPIRKYSIKMTETRLCVHRRAD